MFRKMDVITLSLFSLDEFSSLCLLLSLPKQKSHTDKHLSCDVSIHIHCIVSLHARISCYINILIIIYYQLDIIRHYKIQLTLNLVNGFPRR